MKEVIIISEGLFHDIHRYFEKQRDASPLFVEFLARMGTGWSDEIEDVKKRYGKEVQKAEVILNWPYVLRRR